MLVTKKSIQRLPVSPAWWAILVAGLLLGLLLLHFRDRTRELAQENVRNRQLRCEEIARRIDGALLASRQLTLSLASFGGGVIGDRPGAERLLRQFMNSVSDDLIYGIGLWYAPGIFEGGGSGLFGPYLHRSRMGGPEPVLTYEWSAPDYDYPRQPWYRLALLSQQPQCFTEPYGDLDDVYMSSVAVMRATDGRALGVVTVDVTVTSLERFFAVENRESSETVYVTTRAGRLLYHSDGKRVLAELANRGVRAAHLLDLAPEAVEGALGIAGGGRSPVVARFGTEAGWTVHLVDAGPGSFRDLRRLERWLFGAFIAIVVLGGAALALVDRREKLHRLREDALQADIQRRVYDESRMNRRRRLLETMIRRRTAELTRLNANKDRLMSMLAHDTRGDFMVIRSYAAMLGELIDGRDEAALREASVGLQTSAESAYSSFEEILRWLELQSGGLVCHSEPLDAASVVAAACALAAPRAKLKGIELGTECRSAVGVRADRGMVATVLRNLLANAVKFTGQGGRVVVRVACAAEPPGMVAIEVIDTGVGMPAEEAAEIFRQRKSNSRRGTAGERGLGLGLSICQDLCAKMGGRIWMESAVGRGTTVGFTLPVADVAKRD